VELLILGNQFVDVAGSADHMLLGGNRFQCCDILRFKAWGAQFGSEPLDSHPSETEIVEPGDSDDRNAGRAVRRHLQSIFRRQPAQRLAHGHIAGAEAFGEGGDSQRLARVEIAAHQRVAKLLVYSLLDGRSGGDWLQGYTHMFLVVRDSLADRVLERQVGSEGTGAEVALP
jgi:hypothetical protein